METVGWGELPSMPPYPVRMALRVADRHRELGCQPPRFICFKGNELIPFDFFYRLHHDEVMSFHVWSDYVQQ